MTKQGKCAVFLLTSVSKKTLVIKGIPHPKLQGGFPVIDPVPVVKHKLDSAIQQLCDVSWIFVKDPIRDFILNRKLPFRTVISALLSMVCDLLQHTYVDADVYGKRTLDECASLVWDHQIDNDDGHQKYFNQNAAENGVDNGWVRLSGFFLPSIFSSHLDDTWNRNG